MREVIKKYTGYAIAFLLLVFIAGNCMNKVSDKYIGEGNVYEKQLEKKVKILKRDSITKTKIVDSLSLDNKKKDNAIIGLKNSNSLLNSKIASVKITKDVKLNKAKSFSYKESADFIAAAYSKPESVSYDSTGVLIKNDIPNRVVSTLIENQACQEEQDLTKQVLKNTEDQNSILVQKVENKDKELKAINDFSKSQASTLEASQAANESFKKQNKSLRTGRTIDRILIIGGVIVATIFSIK